MLLNNKLKILSCLLANTLRNTNNHLSRNVQKLVQENVTGQFSVDTPGQEITLDNLDALENYSKLRKSVNNIPEIRSLLKRLESERNDEVTRSNLEVKLSKELAKLPNKTHPTVLGYESNNPVEIKKVNPKPEFDFKPKEFDELARKLNILRMDHLGNFTGHKSYYFVGALAEMEQALIKYTLDQLKPHKFQLMSVPDILPAEVIEGCGMQTGGERTQVYKLTPSGKCLSGTSEMALAGYFQDKILEEDELPLKLAAVSRCFRAETSGLHEEKGVYRVHQFTKVEMFSVCTADQSDDMLEHFKEIEMGVFQQLGVHFKLLDMPPNELGAPAYRKYDIEAWMPGRNLWGEISSCSNCTDYQTKRLNIRYRASDGSLKFAHTVNGTACAVPRILIALLETYQNDNGTVSIPKALQRFMREQQLILKKKNLPELKLVKSIPSPT